MKIIDFHTHIYPDKIAVKGSQSICDFYGLEYHYTGSADVLLDEGRKAGIYYTSFLQKNITAS